MSLSVYVTHRQCAFTLAADFQVGSGLTAIFGPSGSGKTSLINILAGLIKPDDASISFAGTVWNDTARGIFLPAHRRRIGYVFQDGRLFPHMSVRANLLYAERFLPKGERTGSLDRTVDLLGIGHLLDRRPSSLSGGEKQRVALGRTLLSAPKLLLMDEPLSALDIERKAEILPDIERIRDETGVPILYVSHVIGEVARLATHVIAMRGGRIVAAGPPGPILSSQSALASGMPPGSFLHATVTGQMPEHGLTAASCKAGTLYLRHLPVSIGSDVRVRIAASDIMLAMARPEGISALNILEGLVTKIDPVGETDVMVSVDCGGDMLVAKLTRYSAGLLDLKAGMPVFALFKAVSINSEDLFRLGT
ncbi:molybdenum ABC transporter ATP-binding protein [Pararhizobium sp.]|uniref:molybdenum ABC transporter ATP-binding protein n=1 Tax=Pararhizobium sp. TaxID=1977563 RepID=UPI002723901B|nr:molybdenum ABC transporter ATP-binding protein [Pararhizobium sp.]MDO9415707.1 molybdenum ABC transporter ATP-binding protein [Pararhizobium sp.]